MLRFHLSISRYRGSGSISYEIHECVQNGLIQEDDIRELRTWCASQKIPVPTDDQIVMFLLACNNIHETTKSCINAYYRIKNSTPDIFDNRRVDSDDVKKVLNMASLCLIPGRTDDGSTIIFIKANRKANVDTNWNLRPLLKLICMILEAATYENPKCEFIIIFDVEHVTLKHLTKLKPKLLKIFLQFLQEGLTAKLKTIHIINMVDILNKIIKLLKPFIKKEVWEMTCFHSKTMDMEVFYKNCVPKQNLPEELGGNQPTVKVLHDMTMEKLAALNEYFAAEELHRHSMDEKETEENALKK